MICRSCKKDSRFYVPGEDRNFCEHCGEPMDDRSSIWADKQAAKMRSEKRDSEANNDSA